MKSQTRQTLLSTRKNLSRDVQEHGGSGRTGLENLNDSALFQDEQSIAQIFSIGYQDGAAQS